MITAATTTNDISTSKFLYLPCREWIYNELTKLRTSDYFFVLESQDNSYDNCDST